MTDRSNLLITIDAPLFGSVMIFNGRILYKGASYVEPEKIGNSIGFPSYEQILAEATRFWIVDERGVRRRQGARRDGGTARPGQQRRSRITQVKSAKSVSVARRMDAFQTLVDWLGPATSPSRS